MDPRKKKRYATFLAILIIIAIWTATLLFYSPEKVVERIGFEKGYLFVFLVATFGGVSAITATSLFTTVVTLSLGGLNPLLLGIAGGLGASIGDSIFYYFGKRGRDIAAKPTRKRLARFSFWLQRQPSGIIPFIVYLYAGLTPFPNEFVTIPLGLSQYKYRKLIIPLILGNITLLSLIAYLASTGKLAI